MKNKKKKVIQLKDGRKAREMTKMLCFMDFGRHTGFGNVAQEILPALLSVDDGNMEILICAINSGKEKEWTVLDNHRGKVVAVPAESIRNDDRDNYGRDGFLNLHNLGNWDYVFILQDIEVVAPMNYFFEETRKRRIEHGRKQPKHIFWFPIDSRPDKNELDVLRHFDALVTYTNYGRQQIADVAQDDSYLKKIKIIGHGTNKAFYPIDKNEPEKISRIKEFRQMIGLGAGDFLFGEVNQNQPRKNQSTLIRSYSGLRKENSKIKLYLHCEPNAKYGANLERLCRELGLEVGVDVVFKTPFPDTESYDLETLNLLYNSFDCFITATTAEGWGLTPLEALASGVPNAIIPMNTSLKEVVGSFDFQGIYPLTSFREMDFGYGDGSKTRYVVDNKHLIERMNQALSSGRNRQALWSENYNSNEFSPSRNLEIARSWKWADMRKKMELLFKEL